MNDKLKQQQIQVIAPNDFRTTSNFPNYKCEKTRYDTFATWTKTYIDTKKLALYGFYLIEPPDTVECAFCKVRIGKWELGDNVLREHIRWSQNCPLLNRNAIDNIPSDPNAFDAALPKLAKHQFNRLPIVRSQSQVETSSLSLNDCMPHENSPLNFLVNEVHSPDFRLVTDRLESFKEWPKSMKQKPKELSDAGFFYLGKGDLVKCFSCGGGLRDWEDTDDPWEQHALHYEKCHYLNEVKSQQFVISTKRKHGILKNIDPPCRRESNSVAEIKIANMVCDNDNDGSAEASDLKLCQICFDAERCAIFFPCMHVIACVKCSYSCDSCPICRAEITSIKRIYFA